MTSNERKIVKCLWDEEGRMHIQVIAQKTGISSDYARLLCRSLERGGYLKFADVNVCCLLTKGRNRFQDEEITDSDKKSEDENKQDENLVKEIQNEILEEEVKLDELKDATPQEKEKLIEAGYKSVEDLAQVPVNRLIQSIGVNLKKAANWINQARRQTGVIDDKKQ